MSTKHCSNQEKSPPKAPTRDEIAEQQLLAWLKQMDQASEVPETTTKSTTQHSHIPSPPDTSPDSLSLPN